VAEEQGDGGQVVVKNLAIPQQGWEAMLAHAEFCAPMECCGLLAGPTPAMVSFVYPLTNADLSPVAYTIEPYEHYRAWKHAEAHGWNLIGAFHSHPNGPPIPSPTDLRLAVEPDWTYLIVSGGEIRGFSLTASSADEVRLVIRPG
jgi:proteasome lid subunit RPN8/RPN11